MLIVLLALPMSKPLFVVRLLLTAMFSCLGMTNINASRACAERFTRIPDNDSSPSKSQPWESDDNDDKQQASDDSDDKQRTSDNDSSDDENTSGGKEEPELMFANV